MKNTFRISLFILILLTTAIAHGQGGCVDSPENPTALLAVIGGAAACVVSIRNRFR